MKIQTVTLKVKEIVEVDGQFQEKVISTKKYPAALTNKSLLLGKQMGILEGSKITDVIGMTKVSQNMSEEELAGDFDLLAYNQIIYLSVIGLNKNLELTLEEFLDMYQEPVEVTVDLYGDLLEGYFSDNKNNFAQGLKNSTKKNKKKGKK